jgi:serine/threonine-protein kinase
MAESERELAQLFDSDPARVALDPRLPAIVRGEQHPKDNVERLQFAERAHNASLYVAAARLWAEAFDNDPELAESRRIPHRFNAGCAAAVAGCGGGKDVPAPDDAKRAMLRDQARKWLEAELTAWSKLLDSGPAEAPPVIVQILEHWQQDARLVGVREAKSLQALPKAEQEQWLTLWARLAAVLERARKMTRAQPKM